MSRLLDKANSVSQQGSDDYYSYDNQVYLPMLYKETLALGQSFVPEKDVSYYEDDGCY